jgi:basic membrane lipoprotein Med (substrate-binding protein (PBP1-ABC) superfamily)/DNA-binding SARP family transcriptional activator
VDFRILGPIEVASERSTADLGPRKQRALLAVLILHAGELVPVDRLVDLVWGDDPPRTAPHSIQIYISELRRALDPLGEADVLLTRPPGYLLRIDPQAIDARWFERLVREGTQALEEGLLAQGEAAITEALELWRGPPLSDFPYEEFAQAEIRRLQGLRLGALESLAAAKLEARRAQEAVGLAEVVIQADPLRERAREVQMLALYRTGRHAEALRAYQEFHAMLAEELGLDPSPPLRQLQERILLHDPSLGPPGPPGAPAPEPILRNPYKGLQAFGEGDAKDSDSPEVVLVSEGLGGSYNDMIEAGFDRATSRFDIRAARVTANQLMLESILRKLAEDGIPLIVVGYGRTAAPGLDSVAKDFPDTRFVVLDLRGELPNVVYLTLSDEQGSFLVGAAASLKSRTRVIGFIGGVDVDVIWRFQAGYEAGARAVDPATDVRTRYLTEWPDSSGFSSPTLATRAANELYGQGADVIYHAAGYSGVGLFEAARARSIEQGEHLWAIGVDTDQYHWLRALDGLSGEFDLGAWQSHVLTSMVKREDRATYVALQDYARGTLIPGIHEFDLAAGGVDISYSGGFIDDIRSEIETMRERIISGEIVVPLVPADRAGPAAS